MSSDGPNLLPKNNKREKNPRPEILPLFTAAFIIGLELNSLFSIHLEWAFVTLALGCAGIAFLLSSRNGIPWFFLLISGVSAGGFVHSMRMVPTPHLDLISEFDGVSGMVQGEMVGELKFRKKGGTSFFLDSARLLTASQTIFLPWKIKCETASLSFIPEPGQRYLLNGVLKFSPNPVRLQFRASTISQATDQIHFGLLVGFIQERVRSGIKSLLSPKHQALMLGFLLGDTSYLTRDVRDLFRITGITHLLAVSGQHILVLVFIFSSVLCWAGVPPFSRGILSIPILILFSFVTAGQPSVWRAIAMYSAGVLITNLEANPGPMRPISLAAFGMLLVLPDWIHHIGFQLSFLAVIGIVIGRPPIERFLCNFKIPLILSRYLAISFAANFATLPLAGYHFGYLPIVSFLVNPLVVWSFGLILPMGIALAALSHFWVAGGVIVAACLSLILDCFQSIVQLCSVLPMATISTPWLTGTTTVLIYSLMLFFIEKAGPMGRKCHQAASKSIEPVLGKKPNPIRKEVESFAGSLLNDPFKLQVIDQKLSLIRKRPLKRIEPLDETSFDGNSCTNFPVNKLFLESQNLFFRLEDLSSLILRKNPDLLLQSQVFCLALLDSEFLGRIPSKLIPPPTPLDIEIKVKVKNRHLATVLTAEAFFQLPLIGRTNDSRLKDVILKTRQIHQYGAKMLGNFFENECSKFEKEHFAFRRTTLKWCQEAFLNLK
ncbi:ComEC/Rec2 family competence protein [bacterium]|nr:ComEC/Rec2 family competence protein [bacterium]